jgi:CDP-diacylglycerol--serine O-phosphatidyltransferase
MAPALLMVSTIRFRSFKTIDLQIRRPVSVLFLLAIGIMTVATHPAVVLVAMAYTYLLSAFIEMAVTRIKHRDDRVADKAPAAERVFSDSHAQDAARRGLS